MKWFDLKDSGAKLERVRVSPGQHVLRFEMNADSPVLEETSADELEMFGWLAQTVEGGRIVFDNHRSVLKAADVAQSLQAFFPEHVIRGAYKPIEQMSQGEAVEGLKTRDMATLADFEEDMAGVDANDMTRIMASIRRAQIKVQATNDAVSAQPLEGRGADVISKLAELESPEFAVAAVLVATGKHSRPALDRALVELLQSDNGSEVAEALEVVRGFVPERTLNAVQSHVAKSAEIDRIMTDGKASRLHMAMDMMRGSVPIRALELGLDATGEVDELEASVGMKVRRDKSLPTNQYRHTLVATRKSMLAMAEGLNKDASSLIPDQKSVLLRVSRQSSAAADNVVGRQTTVAVHDGLDGEEEAGNATAISVSSTKGGSFVHEFGHLVAEAYSITAEECKDLLENSGVRGRVFRAVRLAVEKEWMSDEHATYLRSDDEIFARTFEAAFVNRAIADGDHSLKTLGGFSAAYPGDQYSPFGDNQLTEKFLADLNTLLENKQALSHGKRQAVASSVEP